MRLVGGDRIRRHYDGDRRQGWTIGYDVPVRCAEQNMEVAARDHAPMQAIRAVQMMQSAQWVVGAVGAACVMRHLSHATFYGTGGTIHLIELSAGWRSRV